MIRLAFVVAVLLAPFAGRAGEPGSEAAHCAAVRDDDEVRPCDASLRAGVLAAFSRLFPNARTPNEQQLRAGAHLRCMDGRLLACFTGANLPCGKLNAARDDSKVQIATIVVLLAGLVGTLVDSFLGATLEDRVPGVGKGTVNFACTLAGAAFAGFATALI